MKRKVPVVRELSWPMAIPQIIALLGCIGVAFLFVRDNSALMLGAVGFLVYSNGVRLVIMRQHRSGVRAMQQGRHQQAIDHFMLSYEFFSHHAWLDRWRSLVLMSASAASLREMALVNVAFCQAQLGRAEEARDSYTRAAKEFPGSPMATAALNLMGPANE